MGVSERRQRDRERRRAAIVEAAEAVFVRDGYEGATMDAVASEAEVSKGTVYLYFESKEALLGAVAERNVGAMLAQLRERVSGAAMGLDAVRGVLETYATHFQARPARARMVLRWILAAEGPDITQEAFEGHRARAHEVAIVVIGAIARAQAEGSVRTDMPAPLIAVQVWGGLLGVLALVLNEHAVRPRVPVAMDMSAVVPHFCETVMRGISTDPDCSSPVVPSGGGAETSS